MRRFVLYAVYLGVIMALVGITSGAADAQDTTVTGTIPLGKVSVSNITSTSAQVSWETMTDSSSQVFYDAISHPSKVEYARESVPATTRVSSHVVALAGLTPSQTYHFRVESVCDTYTALSEDYNFTTLPSGASRGSASDGGGDDAAIATQEGTTDLSPYINNSGVLVTTAVASSDDGAVTLIIGRGVGGWTADGRMLKSVRVAPISDVLAPPKNASLVGRVYELSPDGARFDPAVLLAISYDPATIPSGADERNLIIGRRQEESDAWVELKSAVDVSAHTVTASINQFSRYAVLVHTLPASFNLSDLTISPEVAKVGEVVKVSARIVNSGNLAGNYTAILRINGGAVAERNMAVGGGSMRAVVFTTTTVLAGNYEVDLGGLTGSLVVVSTGNPSLTTESAFKVSDLTIAPAHIAVGDTVTVSALVTNISQQRRAYTATLEINDTTVDSKEIIMDGETVQRVTFQISESVPGTYVVNVGELGGSFEVRGNEAEARGAPWWLLAVSLLAVGGASLLFLWHTKRRNGKS